MRCVLEALAFSIARFGQRHSRSHVHMTATYHSPEWAKTSAAYSTARVRPAAARVYFTDAAQALVPLSFEVEIRGLLEPLRGGHGRHVGRLAAPGGAFTSPTRSSWCAGSRRTSARSGAASQTTLPRGAGVLAGPSCNSDETHAIQLAIKHRNTGTASTPGAVLDGAKLFEHGSTRRRHTRRWSTGPAKRAGRPGRATNGREARRSL
jgi:hypothetical protein